MVNLASPVRLFQNEWTAARTRWETSDPILYAAAPEVPVERLMEDTPTAFGALARAIVHQQVSIYAGRAIVGRLAAACGGEVDPAAVLRLADEDLRSVGLSRQKSVYIRALAKAAVAGLLEDVGREPEDEVVARLVALPGIGVWTAKMFCLFHLGRPDVFSGDDLGLREAVRVLDGTAVAPTAAEAERRAEVWRPYRSVAAVVLWDLLRRTRATK